MLLTMLSRYTGSFPTGVAALAEILDVNGTILPVTTDQATLVAELTDGTRIYGERAIDMPRGHQREKINDVFLVPHHNESIRVYPPVVAAIKEADFIILGPGDLFTSIIPNLVVPSVSEALSQTKAKLVYVINIMTKFGETHNFKASDFINHLESFVGRRIDLAIYNETRPNQQLRELYAKQKSDFVELDSNDPIWKQRRLYCADLLDSRNDVMRHNSSKLADLIASIFDTEAR
jgi:uncharacterized cofD-like protein